MWQPIDLSGAEMASRITLHNPAPIITTATGKNVSDQTGS
jgi:hypothetical protein